MSSWIQQREETTSLLTLMRPPINALDLEALNELTEAVEKVEADRETRVLVITSGIEGIFCSGGDLNFWRQVRDGKEVSRAGREVWPLPVISGSHQKRPRSACRRSPTGSSRAGDSYIVSCPWWGGRMPPNFF
jgi:hypothetical protein